MKKLVHLSFLIALVASIAGCNPEAKATPGENGKKPEATTPDEQTVVKLSDAEDVGDDLRHEGYQYYGLGNDKVLVYDMTMNGTTEEGKQEVKYQGLKDGVPTYIISRIGSLSQLGDETLQLKPEGVLLSETTMGSLNESVIALPQDVAVGKSWSDTRQITRADGKILEMTSNYKVDKMEKLTVPAGEFECLHIISTGTIKHDGKTDKFTGDIYHAKGIGTVKLSINAGSQTEERSGTVVTLKAIEDPK